MLSYEKGYSNSTIEVSLLYAKSGCLFFTINFEHS